MENIENIELTYLSIDDYAELKQAMIDSYSSMPNYYWREHHIDSLLEKFPEGQVVIKVDQQIAGCALSILVDYDLFDDKHTYNEITANLSFDTHDNEGNVLYGIEVFIKPEFRGLRLGRRFYDYRKDLLSQH